MLTTHLIDAMERRYGGPLPDADRLRAQVLEVACRRGEPIFRAGEAVDRLFFVRQGLVKLEYPALTGAARVRDFVAEGQVFAAIETLGRPGAVSAYAALAYEDTALDVLAYEHVAARAATSSAWAQCVALFFGDTAINRGRREETFLLHPPRERFELLVKDRPWLLTRVTQQDLASYLGVTAVSLSRIKSRMLRGGSRAP